MLNKEQNLLDNILVKITTFYMLPIIMLFAFYVQLHGDISPGGGFQAGVIFACSYILAVFIFGTKEANKFIPIHFIRFILPIGVLIYIGTGFVCLFLGGKFLEYNVLAHSQAHGQHWGLFSIELGVGITVFSAMSLIVYMFAKYLEGQNTNDNTHSN
jgi:multicomponent Na+:H+ antiporter subunit B